MSSLNGLLPFAVGFLTMMALGYSYLQAFFVGIVFISSSVSVIASSIDSLKLLGTRLGITSVGSAVLQDILSLIVLSVLLQIISPSFDIPWWVMYGIIIAVVLALYYLVPKLRNLMTFLSKGVNVFQNDVRFVIAILFGVVLIFEFFGLHDIIAGFFAGLLVADATSNQLIREKIRTIGYSFFIPIFFILVGMNTDLQVLFNGFDTILVFIGLFLASVGSKIVSGFWASRILGFKNKEGLVMGIATISQLFTTLAVVFTGSKLEIIPPEVASSLVVLAIIMTFVAPTLVGIFGSKLALSERNKSLPLDQII